MNTKDHFKQSSRFAETLTLCLLLGSGLFDCTLRANQVLLYYDIGFLLGPSRYEVALNNRGYSYQLFTDASSFSSAVQSADTATDLVVIDSVNDIPNFSNVTTFIQGGGRALVQYWNLGNAATLAAALQVTVTHQAAAPDPISPYDWGGSALFNGVTTPLVLTSLSPNSYVHGQKYNPNSGGEAVAGFVSSPANNEAALVIGNSNRTIAQGFFMEEVELTEEAIQFAQNELDYLFGPIAPSSAPWIVSDPQSRTILEGGSVTLRVQAAGSLPLSFQWQQNGTNIAGATNAWLPIKGAQFQHTGSYTVAVSNSLAPTLSAPAFLTVTNQKPIADILLMVDDGTFTSPYETALIDLGLNYQYFSTDPDAFNSAIALADPTETLVILDAYASPWRYSDLVGFVKAGGRALMQNWDLTAGTHLAGAFDVAVIQPNTIMLPVYDWGGSDFFEGASSPLVMVTLSPPLSVHGQKLNPLGGGRAVGGFVSSPALNEAAMVIGNGDRTVVNGFALEEVMPGTNATQVARNQILHFYPLQFAVPSLTGTTLTLVWTVTIPYQDYQVQYKESPADPAWTDLGDPVTAFDTTASTTDTTTAVDQRIYRVVMLP